MIGEEITESAKAVQEVAKTSNTALEIAKDLGGFLSRIIGEPADVASGILKDKLLYIRWERQQRLTERTNQFITDKNIVGELRPMPLKIALPAIENASLEENDELQDLWAHFITSAVDPNFNGTLRAAFVDIIKQLEVNDAHILNYIYHNYSECKIGYRVTEGYLTRPNNDETDNPIAMEHIIEALGIDENSYKESIDNLIRVGCIASYINQTSVKIPRPKQNSITWDRTVAKSLYELPDMEFGSDFNDNEVVNFNTTYRYNPICITPLGLSFAKACMNLKPEENKEV